MLVYALLPLSIIGWLFLMLLTVGLTRNSLECAIALDQWLGTCIISGAMADETISAWAHRRHHKKTERLINWLFSNPNHCAQAYISEMTGAQNAPDYRKD